MREAYCNPLAYEKFLIFLFQEWKQTLLLINMLRNALRLSFSFFNVLKRGRYFVFTACLVFYAIGGGWLIWYFLIGHIWPIHCSGFYVSERGRSLKLRLRATHGCAVQWHYVLFYALPTATLQVTSGTLWYCHEGTITSCLMPSVTCRGKEHFLHSQWNCSCRGSASSRSTISCAWNRVFQTG